MKPWPLNPHAHQKPSTPVTGPLADRLRPGTGAVEDHAGRDLAGGGSDAGAPAAADVDRCHPGALLEPRAEAPRSSRVAHRHRVRAGDPVGRAEGCAKDILEVQGRSQRADLGRHQPAGLGQPEPVPELHQVTEVLHLLGPRQQHQVADLAEVGGHAHLLLESLEHRDAAHPDPHVDLARELLANATGVAGGRAGAQPAALEEEDVDAPAGEVVGKRAAHHPAADDRYVRGFHALPQNSKMIFSAARLVMSLLSTGGATSATSRPTRFAPIARAARKSRASRVVSPPGEGISVPGAAAGARTSMSKETLSGLPPGPWATRRAAASGPWAIS